MAAAELLGESNLNHHQQSFLQTVQACGSSLVETVNHVLDYTKLSGNSRAGGVENMIPPSRYFAAQFWKSNEKVHYEHRVDLIQLIEEAVEGCWVGFRARLANKESDGIGTFYSPGNASARLGLVETVINVAQRRNVSLLQRFLHRRLI